MLKLQPKTQPKITAADGKGTTVVVTLVMGCPQMFQTKILAIFYKLHLYDKKENWTYIKSSIAFMPEAT